MALLSIADVIRAPAPLVGHELASTLLDLAGRAWLAAFLVYLVVMGPKLVCRVWMVGLSFSESAVRIFTVI